MSFKERIKGAAAGLAAQPVVVSERRQLSEELVVLAFSGAQDGSAWTPGQKVKLRVDGVLRSYTPMRWTGDRMELLFHLHGQGPAAQWAAKAQVGDAASYLGPARSVPAPTPADWCLVIGDQTALGLFVAWAEAAERPMHGAVVLDGAPTPVLAELGLSLDVVRADQAALWAERWALPPGRGEILLSGEADMAKACRDALLARGVDRSWIRFKPYWAVRGKARRKEIEREAAR
ncbi:MAG: siderophore-interacting protein [Myxococcota bacterium]|nr:siderophore-interacting protein [Myxococcota bacterium]